MARPLAPYRPNSALAVHGLDLISMSVFLILFLFIVVVAGKRKKSRAPIRKVLPRAGKLQATQYKQWEDEDMEGALHDLAEQYAVNTKTCKPREKCKSLRQIAKEWGVPHVTLGRYFKTPGFFESGGRAGVDLVLTMEDEKKLFDTILRHATSGMCLNHAQVIDHYCLSYILLDTVLVCIVTNYVC